METIKIVTTCYKRKLRMKLIMDHLVVVVMYLLIIQLLVDVVVNFIILA